MAIPFLRKIRALFPLKLGQPPIKPGQPQNKPGSTTTVPAAEHQSYRVQDRVAYWCFRLIVAFVQSLPLERSQRIASLIAGFLTHVAPIRGKLVRENLQRAFPAWQPEQSVATQQQMWEHLVLMLCEVAVAPRKIHRENWYDHYHISVEDRRTMMQIALDRRPKVLVSGHFGNFELAGYVTGLFGIGTTTIARPLDNGFVHDYINRFRSLGGQYLLPKSGSAADVELILQKGGALSLLADQYGGPKGCWVEFLGHPASCHKALALFTLSSGAPMMVCSNVRKSEPLVFETKVLGVADPQSEECPDSVADLTRWYNACLESEIREFPGQYWWVHHRWKGVPPTKKRTAESSLSESTLPANSCAGSC